MSLPPEIAKLQTYACHPAGLKFPSGLCKPAPTEKNIPDAVRLALYYNCVARGGTDEYTSQPCDHLTAALQQQLGVCAYGPSPTVLNDLIKAINANMSAIATLALAILVQAAS